MRRFIDYLLDQLDDLRLEIKAIRKLLDEAETDKRELRQTLAKTNERMEMLSSQLEESPRAQSKYERRAQRYKQLWEQSLSSHTR